MFYNLQRDGFSTTDSTRYVSEKKSDCVSTRQETIPATDTAKHKIAALIAPDPPDPVDLRELFIERVGMGQHDLVEASR